MKEFRRRARSRKTGTIVLVTLGAVAGLAMGMLLADRLGGVEALKQRQTRRRPRRDGWRTDPERSDPFDDLPDDHSELAPEAISHLHLADHLDETAPRRAAKRATTRRGRTTGAQTDRPTTDQRPSNRSAPSVSLEDLEERVLDAFQNDPMLAHRAIDIGAVSPGQIELTGWVSAPAEIDYALIIARGVPGVEQVVNSLAASAEALD